LHFVDETGKDVALADYFHKDRPVVLQLSYFGCPMLCSLVSNGLVESLNDLTLTMGKDFEVINLSFDPSETSALAGLKKQSYHYDAYAGQYTPIAMGLMRGAGILTVLTLATVIGTLIRKDLKTRKGPQVSS